MGNIERWEALAKVSTVAEQMRRRAEAAEAEAARMLTAQNEYWATIERLEAQLAGAVEALREIAEQDAMTGVNGKSWRHWRIIAAEALQRLEGR